MQFEYVAIIVHLNNWSSSCVCVSVYLLECLNACEFLVVGGGGGGWCEK